MYFGPAYKQKYKYVPRIVNSGPGDPDSSHGYVRGSTTTLKKKPFNMNETNIFPCNLWMDGCIYLYVHLKSMIDT